MQSLISQERVMAELKLALAEALRVPEAGILPESSIVRDLGADSLDFLDVNFRLEQGFGIKMARSHFLEHVEEMFGEGTALDAQGRLTEKAMRLVRMRYQGEEPGKLADGLALADVSALITVRVLASVVLAILDTLPSSCACGASAWRAEDGAHITCGACGEAASFTNGDELTRAWLAQVQESTGLFTA